MIKLVVLDVDGCLTDGAIIYNSEGQESKNFNVKDGLAISSWMKLGNDVAIITGRSSQIVQKRAQELGIKHLYQGVKDKKSLLDELLVSMQISLSEVAAIGDDLNDYKMLKSVARSFTPKDGARAICSLVQTQLTTQGGKGAVREMLEILIDENNQRAEFEALWY